MKKIIFVLCSIFLFSIISCDENCDTSTCKYKKGDDVVIKHKGSHDEATVIDVQCGCRYNISYYSYFGTRRHRIVEEVELK